MNIFDKICAVFAALLGLVLLILGVLGLFVGCKAHFTLPPIAGVIPAFAGWGIVRSVYFGWKYVKPPPPGRSYPGPGSPPVGQDGFGPQV